MVSTHRTLVFSLRERVELPIWGFEYNGRWEGANNHRTSSHFIFNATRVAAYVPIINVIVAVASAILIAVINHLASPKPPSEDVRRIYVRCMATAFLGPFLVIPDLAKTLLQKIAIHHSAKR